YCHFTSPIRRYADLMVHRALVSGLGLGEGGLPSEPEDWNALGELVTETERRSVAAERDANDRFAAAYYAARKDEMLSARVSGVTRYGLFVTLSETLADGFVPMSHLPEDYYRLDEVRRRLVGRRSKLIFRIGDLVECKIRDSDPLKGSLILEIIPKTRRPKS
ncbi:MAG: RNB domain-containing ribonuclease, partial [Rhodospirillales bacterium]|nr:RNB domain-containing ribonuclease [Rhodospirillales bacterium]